MSIKALNDNLLEMIGTYASGSAEELAHVTRTSKAFKHVAYTKIHPHLLAAYGRMPALQREVAAVQQETTPLPALFRRIVQGVRAIAGGDEYLVSLGWPAASLQSTRLTALANWTAQEKAHSMLIFFVKSQRRLPPHKHF